MDDQVRQKIKELVDGSEELYEAGIVGEMTAALWPGLKEMARNQKSMTLTRSVSLPRGLDQAVRLAAAAHQSTSSAVICEACRKYLLSL